MMKYDPIIPQPDDKTAFDHMVELEENVSRSFNRNMRWLAVATFVGCVVALVMLAGCATMGTASGECNGTSYGCMNPTPTVTAGLDMKQHANWRTVYTPVIDPRGVEQYKYLDDANECDRLAWQARNSDLGIINADRMHAHMVRMCLTGRGYSVLN